MILTYVYPNSYRDMKLTYLNRMNLSLRKGKLNALEEFNSISTINCIKLGD